jgi:rhamnogalacturonyl hydrolase YesR
MLTRRRPVSFLTAFVCGALVLVASPTLAQPPQAATDSNTPLHLLKPDYPVPYGPVTADKVAEVLQRIHGYLEHNTPSRFVNRESATPLTDLSAFTADSEFEPGAFRPISYEWGVTYTGMLLASETTGDPRYAEYVSKRLGLIADAAREFRVRLKTAPGQRSPLRSVFGPRALDDAGSMCAAMIKAQRAGVKGELRPLIDNYIEYITTKEFRLADRTLARNRPQPTTLWLDDLYMSVPALAQMGALTGDRKYFDEAVLQVHQFAARMFNK